LNAFLPVHVKTYFVYSESVYHLLEDWHIQFEPVTFNLDNDVNSRSDIYKGFVVAMRCIYSYARVLPAYNLMRNKIRNKLLNYIIDCKIENEFDMNEFDSNQTKSLDLAEIKTDEGTLRIKVISLATTIHLKPKVSVRIRDDHKSSTPMRMRSKSFKINGTSQSKVNLKPGSVEDIYNDWVSSPEVENQKFFGKSFDGLKPNLISPGSLGAFGGGIPILRKDKESSDDELQDIMGTPSTSSFMGRTKSEKNFSGLKLSISPFRDSPKNSNSEVDIDSNKTISDDKFSTEDYKGGEFEFVRQGDEDSTENPPETPFDLDESLEKRTWDINNFISNCKSNPPFGLNTTTKAMSFYIEEYEKLISLF